MTWLAEQSRSLNMQQAVLGCSQLENSIPALASCFPSRRSPDPHRARGGAGPRSKHILAGRGEEGGKAESRLSQQTAPPRAHLPLTVPWHTRGRVGGITTQMGTEGPPACLPASLARDESSRDRAPCHGCSRTHKAGPTCWSSGFCTEEQRCLTYFAAEASNI